MTEDAFSRNTSIVRSYGEEFLTFSRGEGVYLIDQAGNRYLDFGSGIAVNSLGHGNEALARIAFEQMRRCTHVSNLYMTEPALELSRLLTDLTGMAAVHFGNSGTEANEAALKFARVYSYRTKGAGNHRLLCFSHAFHGRSMGALSCTPNKKYAEPFLPLIPGVEVIPFNDVEALKKTLDKSFAGVITEVLQGEGGLDLMTPEFAEALNQLCREKDVILIVDEVQTGLGRTGGILASKKLGLNPDIITLAKPLAGGLPLSATLISERVNGILHAGDHGSTFGGGPVQCAVAIEVVKTLTSPDFLQDVEEKGDFLLEELKNLAGRNRFCGKVKGLGFLLGLEIRSNLPGAPAIPDIINRARDKGLLILRSGDNLLRIAPPLVISINQIKKGVKILDETLKELQS